MATRSRESVAIESWFLGRGLPTLLTLRARPATLWDRSLPVLIALYLVMLVPEVFDTSDEFLIEMLVSLGTIVVPWGISNLARRRRLFSRLDTVGRLELVLFVIGPPTGYLVTELVAYDQPIEEGLAVFVVWMVSQLVLLLVIRVLASIGLVALTAWLLRELIGTIAGTMAALARTLPLLLGVVTFFFFTAEVWQSVGRARGLSYVLVLFVFIGLGGTFLASRRHLNIDALATFETPQAVLDALDPNDHPFGELPTNVSISGLCPLGRLERMNLRLVAVLSRMVVAVVVSLAVAVVFGILGVLAIDAEVVKAWTLHDPTILWRGSVPGRIWILSWEHVRVVGFLATFTGFYFSVVSATDPTLREGISDTAEDAVRAACAVRMVCLDRAASSRQ